MRSVPKLFGIRWNYRALAKLGLMALLIVLFFIAFVDQPMAYYCKRIMARSVRGFFRTITEAGLGAPYLIITLLGLLTLQLIEWLRPVRTGVVYMRRWFTWAFLCFLGNGLFLNILKMTIGRRRPLHTIDFDPWIFSPLTPHWDYFSIPSGHSQVSFTAATVLALSFPKKAWLFFLLAAILSFSRVAITAHFLSDIIAGAYVGFAGTIFWYWILSRRFRLPRVMPLKFKFFRR